MTRPAVSPAVTINSMILISIDRLSELPCGRRLAHKPSITRTECSSAPPPSSSQHNATINTAILLAFNYKNLLAATTGASDCVRCPLPTPTAAVTASLPVTVATVSVPMTTSPPCRRLPPLNATSVRVLPGGRRSFMKVGGSAGVQRVPIAASSLDRAIHIAAGRASPANLAQAFFT